MGPNTPLQVKTDIAKDSVSLLYDGRTILKCRVYVCRGNEHLSTKQAGVRLFVVSKVDGWDVIEQKIRVAGVAMLDDDLLRFRSICPKSTETSDQSVSYIRGISDGEYWMHNSEAQFEMFMKYCGSRPCSETITPKSHIEIESYANEMHVIFRPCIDTHSGGVFPAHL